jgi:hypothetical protein
MTDSNPDAERCTDDEHEEKDDSANVTRVDDAGRATNLGPNPVADLESDEAIPVRTDEDRPEPGERPAPNLDPLALSDAELAAAFRAHVAGVRTTVHELIASLESSDADDRRPEFRCDPDADDEEPINVTEVPDDARDETDDASSGQDGDPRPGLDGERLAAAVTEAQELLDLLREVEDGR